MLSMTQEAQEYRKKFYKYYHENIAKEFISFENSRKSELVKYNFVKAIAYCVGIVGLAYLAYCSSTNPNLWDGKNSPGEAIVQITVVLVGLILMLACRIAKNFENEVKEGIMKSYLAFFGDFRWSCKESISKDEIEDSKLVVS